METNSNNGGLLPSAMALKDSLSQKPATSAVLRMLTPLQQELLRQWENEVDEHFASSQAEEQLSYSKVMTQQAAD